MSEGRGRGRGVGTRQCSDGRLGAASEGAAIHGRYIRSLHLARNGGARSRSLDRAFRLRAASLTLRWLLRFSMLRDGRSSTRQKPWCPEHPARSRHARAFDAVLDGGCVFHDERTWRPAVYRHR